MPDKANLELVEKMRQVPIKHDHVQIPKNHVNKEMDMDTCSLTKQATMGMINTLLQILLNEWSYLEL